jgi:hypothetical protein
MSRILQERVEGGKRAGKEGSGTTAVWGSSHFETWLASTARRSRSRSHARLASASATSSWVRPASRQAIGPEAVLTGLHHGEGLSDGDVVVHNKRL